MATQMYTATASVGGHHLSMSFVLLGDGTQGYASLSLDGVPILLHDLLHIPVRRVAVLCQDDLRRLERERHNLPEVAPAELLVDILATNVRIVRETSTIKLKSGTETTNSFIDQLEA